MPPELTPNPTEFRDDAVAVAYRGDMAITGFSHLGRGQGEASTDEEATGVPRHKGRPKTPPHRWISPSQPTGAHTKAEPGPAQSSGAMHVISLSCQWS